MGAANEQIEKCKKNGCPECEYCIGAFYAKYRTGQIVPKTTRKIRETSRITESTKWDLLAQEIASEPTNPDDHPLLQDIIRTFTKQGE